MLEWLSNGWIYVHSNIVFINPFFLQLSTRIPFLSARNYSVRSVYSCSLTMPLLLENTVSHWFTWWILPRSVISTHLETCKSSLDHTVLLFGDSGGLRDMLNHHKHTHTHTPTHTHTFSEGPQLNLCWDLLKLWCVNLNPTQLLRTAHGRHPTTHHSKVTTVEIWQLFNTKCQPGDTLWNAKNALRGESQHVFLSSNFFLIYIHAGIHKPAGLFLNLLCNRERKQTLKKTIQTLIHSTCVSK